MRSDNLRRSPGSPDGADALLYGFMARKRPVLGRTIGDGIAVCGRWLGVALLVAIMAWAIVTTFNAAPLP